MKLEVTVEGMEDLKKVLAKMPAQARAAAERALTTIALDLKGKSQKLAPVDLGDLRGSAFTEVIGLSATIGYTVDYATRQHENMVYQHPKGGQAKYLSQPLDENIKDYIQHISDEIEKAVKK